MRRVISAGGIVIKPSSKEEKILLVRVGPENGLSIPKGHVEPPETIEDAAIREINEETSLSKLRIIRKLGVVTRKSTEFSGEVVLKDIHLYLLKPRNFYQSNHEKKCEWVLLSEAPAVLKFKEESDFLLKIMNVLTEIKI